MQTNPQGQKAITGYLGKGGKEWREGPERDGFTGVYICKKKN